MSQTYFAAAHAAIRKAKKEEMPRAGLIEEIGRDIRKANALKRCGAESYDGLPLVQP